MVGVWWGYGGGQLFWKSQALSLCLVHFTDKLWPSCKPSAFCVDRTPCIIFCRKCCRDQEQWSIDAYRLPHALL